MPQLDDLPIDAIDVTVARNLLQIEAQAIESALSRLNDEDLRRAAKLVLGCSGKVLVSGVGTSGIIARKIAATLTSTGTSAIFLHPSDALHGGLGVVTSGDVVILVSNGGETEELLAILPYLRHREVRLISIVGNLSAKLAKEADAVLDAHVDREGCPLDLAPTASSTLALAMGDALAVTLLRARSLTREGFALNHPSGRLGRRLTLRVRDVLVIDNELPAVAPGAALPEVVSTITRGGVGAAVVVDQSEQLVGIITDGDIRRAIQRFGDQSLQGVTATEVMHSNPITVDSGSLAYDALQEMEDRPKQISVVPVVEAGRCVGILRLHDLVRAGI